MAFDLNWAEPYDENLPDGVYLHLPEAVYFAQDRLGSTDFTTLSKPNAEDWFYGSKRNKRRDERQVTEDRLFGKALHLYVLEGVRAFMAEFVRSEFDDYSAKGAAAEKVMLQQKKMNRLKPGTYADVMHMGELIRNHKQLRQVFESGMSEVTVLFTYKGLKLRARFDKLLPKVSIDLKTFGNHKQQLYDEDTLIDIVIQMRYETQRYLYDIARHALREFVAAGKVFGADAEELEYLQDLAKIEEWKWCWVFYKKVSHSPMTPSAPILSPLTRDPQDATWVRGQMYVDRGIENFKRLDRDWGDTPWARINAEINPDDSRFNERYLRPRNVQYDLATE